jgi:site-specific DNA-methyltransferase (adenine-specific)
MSVIKKVKIKSSLSEWVNSAGAFGASLTTNFGGAKELQFKDSVPLVFGTHVGFIREDQIERNLDWVGKWKVLLPLAGDGHGREVSYVLGEPIALAPGSACTFTYLVAGLFDTKTEAKNYAYYLTTKFVRFLVLQRKATQHVRPEVFKFVPMLDMKRRWMDADLYEHFGLTKKQIVHIEATITPRSVNLSLDSPIPASHLPGGVKYRPPGKEREAAEADSDSDDEVV